ncbi:25S rRNA (uridine(2843)-N(3))-methyltransferase [Trichomonascus vanleenenianus]|uniref:25S rRNA (uracil2843-N3)-methyltransferase n=1 Tax=Trichomonascus vanleenenianus TaxID=2268995 RepID=UPI003ECAA8F9
MTSRRLRKAQPKPKIDVVSQQILDLFTIAFDRTFALGNELHTRIQAVKAHLFDRDYMTAFGTPENLDAYVVRWSPSRAIGYSSLLQSLKPVSELFHRLKEQEKAARVLCIGGGAGAEIVALGSIALLNDAVPVQVTSVDIAKWDPVVDKIVHYIAGNWYGRDVSLEQALEAIRLDGNESASKFSVKFINHDILTLPEQELDLGSLDLITSMFTTNELFAASKAGTVRFLQSLAACKSGTLLLLVESAGSYSEIQIGDKKFPVQFLINHTLTGNNTWRLLEGDDSRWYRVPEGLKYELKLENMRFFFRLYERV